MTDLYPKIPNVFKHDSRTKHLTTDFRDPLFRYLCDLPWVATEKIDGVHARIVWDGHAVSYAGRTDKVRLPKSLISTLDEQLQLTGQVFRRKFFDIPATIYGEGFGPGIRKGEKYGDTVQFAPFDVKVNGVWLESENVRDLAASLGLDAVPVVATGSLLDLGKLVISQRLQSTFGDFIPEGIIARPQPALFDRFGTPIRVKIRDRDTQQIRRDFFPETLDV